MFTKSLTLTLERPVSLSYRDHSINLQSKSTDWFLYEKDIDRKRLRHLRRGVFRTQSNINNKASCETS